jgi:two-component system nitrogen regulation response regulator GlnG
MLIGGDRGIIEMVRSACQKLDAEMIHVTMLEEAEPFLGEGMPNLVLCDFGTFRRLTEQWPKVCALLFAEPADSEQAIDAIKRGALDFLVRPIAAESLLQHIREGIRISHDIHVPAVYEDRYDDAKVDRIIGQSVAMKEVYKLIGRIAPRDINILITGENGTGKDLVARAILHHSPRKTGRFLAVNCAAIPDTLLESELFGHEKGAFTGADRRRIGKFEQCDGGTLFLDEVGDMPPSTQAKLLRVLQDSTFQRLGGTEVIQCDVRIIAATHQSLEQLIQERRFREDLYYRLRVATISVPPLREREVDVVLLAHYFMHRHNIALGTRVRTFSPDVLPALLHYPWPGNVRELENTIKAAMVLARGSVFRLEFLPEHIRRTTETFREPQPKEQRSTVDSMTGDLRPVVEKLIGQTKFAGKLHATATAMIEREVIRACLHRTQGRLAQAAKLLGISRTTLRKKMESLGIQVTASLDEIDSSS